MSRLALLGFALALLAATGLYVLKDRVQLTERDLHAVRSAIQAEQGRLDRLRAEWAMLNRPTRLAGLAETHLDLAPATPSDIVAIDEIPYRSELRLAARRWLATLPSGAETELRLKPVPTIDRLLERTGSTVDGG
jgi:cell division protein FtsL